MRRNKADFYTRDGAGRQLRTLNHKPEKLPQEKQDAIRCYYATFAREEYHEKFRALTDYTAARKRLDDTH